MAGKGLNLFAPEDVFMPIGMEAIGQHGESIVIRIIIILSARTTRLAVKEAVQTAS
jgi:hypothetical protein